MNKKQFAKIVSLHKEGVGTHTCVVAILQMVCGYENSSVAFRTAAEDIDKFYKEEVFKPAGYTMVDGKPIDIRTGKEVVFNEARRSSE